METGRPVSTEKKKIQITNNVSLKSWLELWIWIEYTNMGKILEIEPLSLTDDLDVSDEEKGEIKDNSWVFGLSNWQMTMPLIDMGS